MCFRLFCGQFLILKYGTTNFNKKKQALFSYNYSDPLYLINIVLVMSNPKRNNFEISPIDLSLFLNTKFHISLPKYILFNGHKFRVHTQIAFSNSLCFPCFFPVQQQIFPVPIYMICDYNIHQTDLANLSSFNFFWEIFSSNFEISFTFRIREYTTWAYQIPCVLAKFPNSLCFPWQGMFLAIFPVFPVFPVQWVPCKLPFPIIPIL